MFTRPLTACSAFRPRQTTSTRFLAAGGIKPGITYGASDDLGLEVVKDKVHVHDLQATVLHLPPGEGPRPEHESADRSGRIHPRPEVSPRARAPGTAY